MNVQTSRKTDRQKLEALGFPDDCASIKSARSWPGDISDSKYVCDLMRKMLAAGFKKSRAIELIAESGEPSEALVKQWSRYIGKPTDD